MLDKYSETVTALQHELEKELELRKKQYAYYRDYLLDFGDDVEWRTLGEIATGFYRGSGIKRDELTENGTPCIRYGEIYTTYGIHFDKCVSYTDENNIKSKKYMEYGDILFAITGESVEDIAKSTVYIGKEKCLVGGDIVVMKHKQNPKYLSYALSTTNARIQKSKGKIKSKVVHASLESIKQIKIPVPTIEEQERIVNILDRFDTLCNDLTSGIPAEIEARKKQYEYYRNKLLQFKIKNA
ncbi:MAG: restriction endonuclease subunit S [Ruminococcus sp.]|nr:restriction endonuclease subunit S [Ruminococcus sp.]